MNKEYKQYQMMIKTPISQVIPRLAIPTVISMMVSMIYNLVDAFFVGQLGTSASAAIGILMSVQSIFQAIGFMCGHGSGSRMSVCLGKGHLKEAHIYASTAFFCSFLISLLPAFIMMVFITPTMTLLGSTPTILPYARIYGTYILLSGPFLAASCVLNNLMRYEGKASLAMIGLVFGGVLNMMGDPLFMFALKMGIHGAGLSTMLSQIISFFILLFMFLTHKTISRISFNYFKPFSYYFSRLVSNGLPSLLRQVLNSLSTMTLNICAKPYGDSAIAAMSIVGRIVMFFASTMIGIGQGLQPVAAYNYGARKYCRIRESFKFTLLLGEILLGIFAIFGFIYAPLLIRLFRDDYQVVIIGTNTLRFHCIAMLLEPVSVVSNMLFQSIGKSKEASFLASLRSGLCFIPVLLILPQLLGILGLQMSQMVSNIMTSLICIPFLYHFFKELPLEDEMTELDKKYQNVH